MASPPEISVTNLTYTFPQYDTGLTDVSLHVPARSRTLLIGANGAGKTTLLRLLAGKRLAPSDTISVSGVDPFKEGLEGVTYLGLEWVLNPIVRTDIVGLVRPWTVLLLDEITVDLDVLSRAEFLGWLKQETEARDCTIVYATHILDNLAGWPTHLVHMHLGTIREWGPADKFLGETANLRSTGNSRLGELVLGWLRDDLKARGPRNVKTMGTEGMAYSTGGIGGYGLEHKD